MAKDKLKKFMDDLLAAKRDMVFTKIDQVTNNIIMHLEEMKELKTWKSRKKGRKLRSSVSFIVI
jgi:hypothetical protein